MYKFKAVATGKGIFPFDMLRYDECWPSDPSSVDCFLGDNGDGEYKVYLTKYSDASPALERAWTKARWNSFGWTIESLDWKKVQR